MAFKVKARVLLELGAELISSDGIALYELIKNAIDAGSESIEVRVCVALTPSGYRLLDHELEGPNAVALTQTYLDRAIARCFEPAAPAATKEAFKHLLTGKQPSAARRHLRKFFRDHTYIEVEDWGSGMSRSDLDNYYLTVGTPNRAHQRLEDEDGERQNRVLGEKGIGRLSAMRLGNYLEVITGPEGTTHWEVLEIDWKKLGNMDMDIGQFTVSPEQGDQKERSDKGTLIRISDLRSDWSLASLSKLAESELGKLQDPFDAEADILDLTLSFNSFPVTTGEELDREWLSQWHGYFDVTFSYAKNPTTGEREAVLTGEAKFRVPGPDPAALSDEIDEHSIHAVGDGLLSLLSDVHYPATRDGQPGASSRFDGIDTLGPFAARGYWYNRQRSQREQGEEYAGFKRWLEQWAGGLHMYRDGFRVYPYAAPDDDWLELDQRALKQRSFKLNRGQFVGYVRITSKGNPALRDQTNRQGLCDAPEKRALIAALQYVIWKELGSLVRKYEVKSAARTYGTIREIDKQVKEKSRAARTTLRELGRRSSKDDQQTILALRDYVEDMEAAWSRAKKTIKSQEDQAEMYLHLAGVGMLLEFVIHELTRVTSATLSDLKSTQQSALPPGLRSLSKQLQTLEKRLRILDPVSTPGRQRKEEIDVGEVIRTLLEAHEQQFERHMIYPDLTEKGVLSAKVVAGQMYQIFENLISNSIYWLTHHRSVQSKKRHAPSFDAKLEVKIDGKAGTLTFSDNGGGIDPADKDKIFDPFFSKKPSGRGIGLFIVKNLCKENEIGIDLLPVQKGRIPGFVFTFK